MSNDPCNQTTRQPCACGSFNHGECSVTYSRRARALADRIFALDAQYQGGSIKAANRDDFINRYIVPILMRAAT